MSTTQQKTKFIITASSLLSDSQKEMIQQITNKYLEINSDLNCFQDEFTNFITIESNNIIVCQALCKDLLPYFPESQIVLTITLEKQISNNPSVFLRNFIIPSNSQNKITEIYNISYIYTENSNEYLVQASGVGKDVVTLEVSDVINNLDDTHEIYTSTLQVATSLLQ